LSWEPLTVLAGSNGAGKTSLIHAFLLARQAALNPSARFVDLNGPYDLSLGDALDVLNRDSPDQSIQIEVIDGLRSAAEWHLAVPGQERALSLEVVQRPDGYVGILAQPEPQFTYLCAERLGPRDVLGTDSAALERLGVGVHGELTAQVLAVHQRYRVPSTRCIDSPDPDVSTLATLQYQVEWWMRRLVRPIQINAEWFPGTNVTRLQFRTPGVHSEWTRPPNMGFGVSYALPIVVAALRAPDGGILIVENPEAHLHPAGQSAMGELLALAAGDGVQVVVETHSDHVINGIRRAVVEGIVRLQPQQVVIHFVRDEPSDEPVTTIELDQTGTPSAWPPGFFDQIERDLGRIARKRAKRT
jgi:predicted ATPase